TAPLGKVIQHFRENAVGRNQSNRAQASRDALSARMQSVLRVQDRDEERRIDEDLAHQGRLPWRYRSTFSAPSSGSFAHSSSGTERPIASRSSTKEAAALSDSSDHLSNKSIGTTAARAFPSRSTMTGSCLRVASSKASAGSTVRAGTAMA